MTFLAVLAGTTAFCLVCKDLIRAYPAAFYVVALSLSLMYAVTSHVSFPFWLQQMLFLLMQKGTLATALFVVVMYMGVFKGHDLVKHRLMPTRATLSIMACILVLGHVAKYLGAYLARFGALSGVIRSGLVVAIACFALMLVLGATSFQAVRRRMSGEGWARLQKSAYVFYALVYAHLVLLLLPSAMSGAGGGNAAQSIAVYTVVFGVYAVLRAGKAVRDQSARSG